LVNLKKIVRRDRATKHICSASFDHLVGEREGRSRGIEARRPGGLEVDHQFELGRPFVVFSKSPTLCFLRRRSFKHTLVPL